MRCGLLNLAAVAGVAFVTQTGTANDTIINSLPTSSGAYGNVSAGSSQMLLAQSGVVPRKNYYNDLFLDKSSQQTPSPTPAQPTTAPAQSPTPTTNSGNAQPAPNYADMFKAKPAAPVMTAQAPVANPAAANVAYQNFNPQAAPNAQVAPGAASPYGFYGSQPIATAQPQPPQAPAQTFNPQVNYNTANYSQPAYNAAAPATTPAVTPTFNQAGFPQTAYAPATAPAQQRTTAPAAQPFGQVVDPAFGGNAFAANPFATTQPQATPAAPIANSTPTQANPYQSNPYQPAPTMAAAQPRPAATPASPPVQQAQAAPVSKPAPSAVAQTKTFATAPQVDAMQSTYNKFRTAEPDSTRSLNYADYARSNAQPGSSGIKTVGGTEATANSFLADPFMDQKPAPAAAPDATASANPATDFTFEFLKKDTAATSSPSTAATNPKAAPLTPPKQDAAPRSNVTITRGTPNKPAPSAQPKATFSPAVTSNREFASASLGGDHDSPNGPQKPIVKIFWRKTSDFNIGRECTAELVVENQSQADAFDVEAIATFPPLVRLTDAKPAPEESSGRLLWRMGTLPAGKTQVIAVKMIPSQAGALNVTADVRFSASSASEFQVFEPMLSVEVNGPEQVMVGDPASHSVTISNPGTGITKDVKIEAVIPRGIEHPRGEKLLLDVGSLNPGETRTVRLALSAVEGGDHRVVILASAESGLAAKAESIIHVISPELTLNVDGPSLRYMGRTGKYKITVQNSGTIGSSNVRVMHKIPTGMQYVSADKGATYDAETRILSWFVGRLAPEASADIEIELMAKEIGEYTHYIRATSEHGSQFDAQVATKIDGVPSLSLEIVDLDDPVEVGAPTSYDITVKNDGSVDATNVAIACELPQGVQFISAQGPTDSLAEIDMILFRPLARLAPGETVVYKLNVKGLVDGNLRTRVRLASDSADQALTFEELTRFYGDAK